MADIIWEILGWTCIVSMGLGTLAALIVLAIIDY